MGMEVFRKACEEKGIDTKETLILGRGCKHTKENRYYLRISTGKVTKNTLYVVQFCKDIDLFIAWYVHRNDIGRRTIYSVAGEPLINIGSGLNYINKNVEYSGWNEESVTAFRAEDIDVFLTTKVLK